MYLVWQSSWSPPLLRQHGPLYTRAAVCCCIVSCYLPACLGDGMGVPRHQLNKDEKKWARGMTTQAKGRQTVQGKQEPINLHKMGLSLSPFSVPAVDSSVFFSSLTHGPDILSAGPPTESIQRRRRRQNCRD